MRTYYRSPDILITDRIFMIRQPVAICFKIDELIDAHVVKLDAHPARAVTTYSAVLVPALALTSLPLWQSFAEQAVAVTAALAPTAIRSACFRLTPPAREIRATHGVGVVTLFRTTDQTRFGQVRRALLRSLENRDERRERDSWQDVDGYRP